MQILILLLATTETPTTAGLETIFNQASIFGIHMNPKYVLAFSVGLSLKTCVTLHVKAIAIEKIFFTISTRICVLAWGLFSTFRRILSIVAFFTPSMGLFNILYHHHAEQLPFRLRIQNAKNVSPSDEIGLFGMTESVRWSQLDRWDYSRPESPAPPNYCSQYTYFNLKEMVWVFMGISSIHLIAVLVTKKFTSEEFGQSGDAFNKVSFCMLH